MKNVIAVLYLDETDWGLLGKAAELAFLGSWEVHAVFKERKTAEQAYRYGASKSYVVDMEENDADDYRVACFLKGWVERQNVNIILAPASVRMRGVMPILAGFLGAGLTADCTELRLDENGRMIQVRPAFGNHLMAWIESTSRIQMATVRPGIFRPRIIEKETKIPEQLYMKDIARVKMVSFEALKETCPLSQSRIILAGGMGIGSKENFQFLASLAKKNGAGLGASRKAVDAGFAPYSCQVGQTGVTVHPDLYIAVGISGAVQHLAGMSGSGKIVAVNNDEHAPIFNYADYGIVGDWKNVLEKLL